MSDQMLSAAVRINVSINKALMKPDISSDEVMRLTAMAVNILLYDYIEQRTEGRGEENSEEKTGIEP